MSKSYIAQKIRKAVYTRAKGCCEYCLIPEIATFAPHEIDHVIAEKHGGLTRLENLALSCSLCNKYKGSDLTSIDPNTGEITPLFHPRQDLWSEHFQVIDTMIIAKTAKGRVTERLLQFNNSDRLKERKILIDAQIFKQ